MRDNSNRLSLIATERKQKGVQLFIICINSLDKIFFTFQSIL